MILCVSRIVFSGTVAALWECALACKTTTGIEPAKPVFEYPFCESETILLSETHRTVFTVLTCYSVTHFVTQASVPIPTLTQPRLFHGYVVMMRFVWSRYIDNSNENLEKILLYATRYGGCTIIISTIYRPSSYDQTRLVTFYVIHTNRYM